MKRRTLLALLLLPALLALPPLPGLAQTEPDPKAAQSDLPKEKLTIITRDGQRHDFQVELAKTQPQQTVGLMFRSSVPEDGGMLFDLGHERNSEMWMRNTVVSLDMVFIRADGTIRSIAERTVPQSLAVVDSNGPVLATLELAAGTTERLGIRVGDKVEGSIFGKAP